MGDIRTRLTCYRLFTNEHGFDDWERYPKYDLETTDDSNAIIHMSECADAEMGFEKFVFRVESWEDERDGRRHEDHDHPSDRDGCEDRYGRGPAIRLGPR